MLVERSSKQHRNALSSSECSEIFGQFLVRRCTWRGRTKGPRSERRRLEHPGGDSAFEAKEWVGTKAKPAPSKTERAWRLACLHPTNHKPILAFYTLVAYSI